MMTNYHQMKFLVDTHIAELRAEAKRSRRRRRTR